MTEFAFDAVTAASTEELTVREQQHAAAAAPQKQKLRKTFAEGRPIFEAMIAENRLGNHNSTGIAALDTVLNGGFPKKGLGLLFANTSLGKSTLVDQIAVRYVMAQAAEGEVRTAMLFTTENDLSTTIAKTLNSAYFEQRAQLGAEGMAMPDLSIDDIETGRFERYPRAIEFVNAMFSALSERLCIVESFSSLDTAVIETELTAELDEWRGRFQGQKVTPLIVVDLMNHVHPDDAKEDRRLEIDQALLELRKLALNCGLFILCVCSTSRTAYTAPLDTSALKESSGLESYADLCMGLDVIRDKTDKGNPEKTYYMTIAFRDEKKHGARMLELIVFKNRKGQAGGRICCAYFPQHDYFDFSRSLEPEPEPAAFRRSYKKPDTDTRPLRQHDPDTGRELTTEELYRQKKERELYGL